MINKKYIYDLNFLGKDTFRPDLVCFFMGAVVSGCTSDEGSDESADVSDGTDIIPKRAYPPAMKEGMFGHFFGVTYFNWRSRAFLLCSL